MEIKTMSKAEENNKMMGSLNRIHERKIGQTA
jgi:hypothetical protein